MLKWAELKHVMSLGKTVDMQLCSEQLIRDHYYVKSIAEVAIFLAVNELGFRGDTDTEHLADDAHPTNTDEPCSIDGLFLRLFEYSMKEDEKLKNTAMSVPKKRKVQYTSPEIQNEIIATLAGIVQDNIVDQLKKSDIGLFCLKCDETHDAQH